MGHFADQETPGGYLAGEVSSALQKSLRRGLEREALYWATELDLAGYGNYVFKRLRIIASEDVGPADSMVAVQVRALYENWVEARKGKPKEQQFAIGERLFLVHAVIILARAPKSRTVDHALTVMYEGDREPLEIPDWALDRAHRAGQADGPGARPLLRGGRAARGRDDPRPVRGGGAAGAGTGSKERLARAVRPA